jgi:hypothetical protein
MVGAGEGGLYIKHFCIIIYLLMRSREDKGRKKKHHI